MNCHEYKKIIHVGRQSGKTALVHRIMKSKRKKPLIPPTRVDKDKKKEREKKKCRSLKEKLKEYYQK